jgi:glycosyltransferase involved in cell wall biosynthesis
MRTAPINLASIAVDLQAKGHKVQVVTGFPNHPMGKIYNGYKQRIWQWDKYRGVSILRLPLIPDHSKFLTRRLVNFSSFAASASMIGPALCLSFKPDVLFVYFAPVTIGLAAWWYSAFFKAPIVYWITDLWTENLIASGIKIKPRIYNYLRKFEDWCYSKASHICVDSPGFKKFLVNNKITKDKIHIITEWAEEDLFFPVDYDKKLAVQHKMSGKFNIVYGGNLGTVQALHTVVEAAEKLVRIPDLQFVFIGDGNEIRNLKRSVKERNLSNIRFIKRQPMKEIHKFFALGDVLLVHLKKEPIFELQLPSKVIAYMACGKPILCAVSGSVEEVVLNAKAGLSCPSEDPSAMAELARRFYMMPKKQREEMENNARKAYLNNYTRSVQVKRIEKILQKAVK